MAGHHQLTSEENVIWKFDVCNCGGVPVSIHYTLFLLLFIQVFATTLSYHEFILNAFMFVLYGPVMFTTVMIHELGHAFAARSLGGIVDRIVLWPLGGFSIFSPSDGSVCDDLWVSLAGPLTHIPQCGFWLGIYAIVEHGDISNVSVEVDLETLRSGSAIGFISTLAISAFELNIGLLLINLMVPAYPLDGGRALTALLIMGGFKIHTAARITGMCGILAGLSMLFLGVYFYTAQASAGSLFILLIAAFVISSGQRMWQLASLGELYEHPLFQSGCYQRQRRTSTTSRGDPSRSTMVSRASISSTSTGQPYVV